MRMSRKSETEMVASAAISRARVVDRGFVVKTTKYDIELVREKLAGWGSVTCASEGVGRGEGLPSRSETCAIKMNMLRTYGTSKG